ncbi:hypothetical protein Dimus_003395 [Dionaea muscipula]
MQSELGKLFIGGISWETNEDRLREYFSTFGDVVEAVIMKDRATRRALVIWICRLCLTQLLQRESLRRSIILMEGWPDMKQMFELEIKDLACAILTSYNCYKGNQILHRISIGEMLELEKLAS